MQAINTGRGGKVGQEPRPHNAVVHLGLPACGVAASGRSRRAGDHLDLAMGGRQPWFDGAAGHEGEKGIPRDQYALPEPVREQTSDR